MTQEDTVSNGVLGGSWVVLSEDISPLIEVITIAILLLPVPVDLQKASKFTKILCRDPEVGSKSVSRLVKHLLERGCWGKGGFGA